MHKLKEFRLMTGLLSLALLFTLLGSLPAPAAKRAPSRTQENAQCGFKRDDIRKYELYLKKHRLRKNQLSKAQQNALAKLCGRMEELGCPDIPKICGTEEPSASNYEWVYSGKEDPCEFHDAGESSGASPHPAKCNAGTVGTLAVCWDGKDVKDKYHPEKIWCTYKDKECRRTGHAGKSPGQIYECKKQ
jgi:hypothetical protein